MNFQGWFCLEKYFRAKLKLKDFSAAKKVFIPQKIFFLQISKFYHLLRRRQLTQAARHLAFDLMK